MSPLQLNFLQHAQLCSDTVIITTECHYFSAYDQAKALECGDPYFLLEPLHRNSAASIILACFSLDPETIVLISHTGISFENEQLYRDAVKKAEMLAEQAIISKLTCVNVGTETFHPRMETHENACCNTNRNYQNDALFCFKVNTMLNVVEHHFPELYMTSKQAYMNATHDETTRIATEDMKMIPQLCFSDLLIPINDKVQNILCQKGA